MGRAPAGRVSAVGGAAGGALLAGAGRMKTKRLPLACAALFLCVVGARPAPARAQTVTINAGAGLGTGMELGTGGVLAMHKSPLFLMMDLGLRLDNDQRFEFGAAVLVELEGRVGVAVEPRLRINAAGRRLRPYFLGAVPIFVAPYTLFGIGAGPGLGVAAWRSLLFYAELMVRAYPFGSDLPQNSALFHFDLACGVRYAF